MINKAQVVIKTVAVVGVVRVNGGAYPERCA
jgi:hypothetical protein